MDPPNLYIFYFAFLLCGILVIYDQIKPLHNTVFLGTTFGMLILGLVVLNDADGLIVLLALLFLQTYKNVFITDMSIDEFVQVTIQEESHVSDETPPPPPGAKMDVIHV